jgi:hypothetical protein
VGIGGRCVGSGGSCGGSSGGGGSGGSGGDGRMVRGVAFLVELTSQKYQYAGNKVDIEVGHHFFHYGFHASLLIDRKLLIN